MLLPYLMALVVVEYVWYMHEMHFGTRQLWRRLGSHVTEQAFWSLAPKTSLLLLLLWLIHPTWFERFLEIAHLKYPALGLKQTHSFRKRLQVSAVQFALRHFSAQLLQRAGKGQRESELARERKGG